MEYYQNSFVLSPPYCTTAIRSYGAGYKLDFHSHKDFYHFNIITQGTLFLTTAKEQLVVPAGSIYIMPPGVEHMLYTEHGYSQIGTDIQHIDKFNVSNILAQISLNTPKTFRYNNTDDITRQITKKFLNEASEYNALKFTNIIESVILTIYKNNSDKSNNSDDFRSRFIIATKELGGEYSLEILCRKLHCSKTHLERLVKNEFGCTAVEYMNRIKHTKICNLLLTTSDPLYIIAEKLGFYDSSHLSVFFKKRSGTSPENYRKIFK